MKIYESEKEGAEPGGWRHRLVRLRPASRDPRFEPIVLHDVDQAELEVIAELLEVLGS